MLFFIGLNNQQDFFILKNRKRKLQLVFAISKVLKHKKSTEVHFKKLKY